MTVIDVPEGQLIKGSRAFGHNKHRISVALAGGPENEDEVVLREV